MKKYEGYSNETRNLLKKLKDNDFVIKSTGKMEYNLNVFITYVSKKKGMGRVTKKSWDNFSDEIEAFYRSMIPYTQWKYAENQKEQFDFLYGRVIHGIGSNWKFQVGGRLPQASEFIVSLPKIFGKEDLGDWHYIHFIPNSNYGDILNNIRIVRNNIGEVCKSKKKFNYSRPNGKHILLDRLIVTEQNFSREYCDVVKSWEGDGTFYALKEKDQKILKEIIDLDIELIGLDKTFFPTKKETLRVEKYNKFFKNFLAKQ